MRFSIAALVVATGAVASSVTTEVVTAYTTYCPEATSIVHGSQTYSIATPGHITMTNGPYTVTRPIQTSTVTQCQSCSTAVPQVSASSVPVIPVAPSGAASTPLVPNADATGSAGASGTPVPSMPAFNAGAANAAAGAGAGLAAVFGAVALLL
ncbi:unnamed protein product [Penicillium olsonii]|uniref:Clock-controlled protein 6 n=1 Tax=Penicillium olsonii TaxID=99116 RepID=A0A9W4HB52_PENOL|nr:unnamed protein product [Penicillium olsonii]CAG7931937.1 unnamed protein product [Penicillium olsonii]CAG7954490.1 unnamed protein product [Penicillium olsonii]CAG8170089.1 unnamed protein product [Penicillium olsonii]CAG8209446.1 unnamed protein product [Penicillium olsonii]